jgi:hypothetical protein
VERFEDAVKEVEAFVEKYPRSKSVREAETIKADSQKKLEKLKTVETNGL